MHRLRRLRGRLPERRRPAVHRRPSSRTSTCCRRASQNAGRARIPWSARWRRTSAAARTTRECEAVCPKGISIDFIAQMNRDFLKAQFRDRRKLVRQIDVADEG